MTAVRHITRRASDLPLQWKILLPFAMLSVLYAAAGTFVLSRGTAAERHAGVTSRLRDIAAAYAGRLEEREVALVETARSVAHTDGVAAAVARADESALLRLVLPPALNSNHSIIVVTGPEGRARLELGLEAGRSPAIRSGTDWAASSPAGAVRSQGTNAFRDLHPAFVRQGGTSYLAVAAPVLLRDELAGIVIAGERLDSIIDPGGRVPRGFLSLRDPAGAVLAGVSLRGSPRTSERALQSRARFRGRSVDVLYVPLFVRGERVATLAAALPAATALGALGREGWKISLLALGSLGGVFFAGIWVSRWISRPLADLLHSTRALRRGEFTHRISSQRRDEFGELARSFDEMAADLEELHGDLKGMVEERTAALEEALANLDRTNTELAQASEAKSVFLASMSHELRTPLSAILMAAELLRDPSVGPLPLDQVEAMGTKIVGGARHLLGLIDDLLDLSRIEAGRLELFPVATPLPVLVAGAVEAVQPMADEKGVALEIPDLPDRQVHADPLRSRQVLINLLANAVKNTQAGGRVWVETKRRNGTESVSVRDTGIGISGDDLERIFEPFEQVEKGKRQGLGLGLGIARQLAQLQGGALAAASTPGKGSTFTLSLPASKTRPRLASGARNAAGAAA